MALVAEAHPVDQERTRFLGRVMGAAALGVLIGYPFGGITFALFGKLIPFVSIALIAALNIGNTLHWLMIVNEKFLSFNYVTTNY